MVINGTSYAALGWRPTSLTKSCKNFPQIGPKIIAPSFITKPEPTLEVESTREPKSEPEPASEPEPTSEPEPSSEAEPTSEPESTTLPESKTEPEIKSEPEPKSKPEPNSESKSIVSSTPEPTIFETTAIQDNKYRKSLYTRSAVGPESLAKNSQPAGEIVETSVSYHVSKKQSE